jgi:hypothetical protein
VQKETSEAPKLRSTWHQSARHPDGEHGVTAEKSTATAVASVVVLALFIGPYLLSQMGLGFGAMVDAVATSMNSLSALVFSLPVLSVFIVIASAVVLAIKGSSHITDPRNKFKLHNIVPRRRQHRTRSRSD